MNIQIRKYFSSELIFLLWCWMVPIVQIIVGSKTIHNKNYYIFFIIFLILFSLKNKTISIKGYILCLIIYCIFIQDYFFRYNNIVKIVIQEYTFFIVLSIYFFQKVKSIKKILKLNMIISILIFFLTINEGLGGNKVNNYMSYGFNILLPATIGIRIGRKYLKYKVLFILEIIVLIFLILYSNRSSVLTYFLFCIILDLLLNKRYRVKKIIFFVFSGIILILNIKTITEIIYTFLSMHNLQSRIITKMFLFFNEKTSFYSLNTLSAGRLELYNLAFNEIRNNILLGKGVGIYESIYNIYSHNIFLDLLLEYGVIGLLIFLLLIIFSWKRIMKFSYYNKIYGIMLFFLWFPKLFFSGVYYKEKYLWLYILYGLFYRKKRKRNVKTDKKGI